LHTGIFHYLCYSIRLEEYFGVIMFNLINIIFQGEKELTKNREREDENFF